MTIEHFRGSYSFLSNFAPFSVFFEGIYYPTVENAYQAAKTTDLEVRKEFETIAPGQAKRRVRRANFVLRPDWDDIKLQVMEVLLREKFSRGTRYRDLLDQTKGEEIIEGNAWHDNFWGNCSCKKRPECGKEGKNHLGMLLMKIRDEKE